MGTFFRVDEDAAHGLEKIVEDLLEVRGGIQGGRVSKDVTIENLQEKLDVYC